MSEETDDRVLFERIAAGDEEAFIRLYRDRQGAIYRFALQMTGSPSVAEDVTQDVFLALIRDTRHFDPARGTVAGYLFGIARNIVADHLRGAASHLSSAEAAPDGKRSGPGQKDLPGNPLNELTRREAEANLRQAILALPEHYREVVVLCDLHEMDYARAAQILGCAVGTVRSRLHRARELLAKKLNAPQREEEGVKALKTARCES